MSNKSFIFKKQKNNLILIVFLVLLGFFALNVKGCKRHKDDNNAIDPLLLKLSKEKELNALYIQHIAEITKSMDSLKKVIEENKNKLIVIKNRKTDESNINYSNWTTNEFTYFLSNRYK